MTHTTSRGGAISGATAATAGTGASHAESRREYERRSREGGGVLESTGIFLRVWNTLQIYNQQCIGPHRIRLY